jgi:hypothetical protein
MTLVSCLPEFLAGVDQAGVSGFVVLSPTVLPKLEGPVVGTQGEMKTALSSGALWLPVQPLLCPWSCVLEGSVCNLGPGFWSRASQVPASAVIQRTQGEKCKCNKPQFTQPNCGHKNHTPVGLLRLVGDSVEERLAHCGCLMMTPGVRGSWTLRGCLDFPVTCECLA